MEIKPEEVIYKKSEDPNIIIRYRLDVSEIHMDKLDDRINILDTRIKNDPSVDKWYGETLNRLINLREELKKL